ncbi:MAG: hypothetical protein HeimC2_45690 [Candidatus Heimdallarchaeota archaeon LC_2]|nr:MAG: hypothetical protein HeimC2_45690 [Candidatus Heimdallarchaeota archaeon LC_2]
MTRKGEKYFNNPDDIENDIYFHESRFKTLKGIIFESAIVALPTLLINLKYSIEPLFSMLIIIALISLHKMWESRQN